MPIYEYRCPACKRRVSVFFRSLSSVDHAAAACPHCGARGLQRVVSRARMVRGASPASAQNADDDGLDSMEREMASLDENDPRSLGRFMRKVAAQARDDGGEAFGPEFDEVVDRLERGESPEDIEAKMGDAFGGEAADGMDDYLGAPPPPEPPPAEPEPPKARPARRARQPGKRSATSKPSERTKAKKAK